jgi:outer membrane protein
VSRWGMSGWLRVSLPLPTILGMWSNGLAQQPAAPSSLTIQQAVQIALEKNPVRKAAIAETKVAAADIREARSFLMPHFTFSETAMRGNDPVYVFGSKLRQDRFTTHDFALNELNTPAPFGDFATRFSGTWTLFDSFVSWRGINRARQMNEAAAHELDRTDQETVFRVISAFNQVLLARMHLDVAEQAGKTAQAIVDRSQARFDTGVVVEADLLTAKVRLAARQQELIRSQNDLELAGAQLNTAMGMPAESSYEPIQTASERLLPVPVLADLEKEAMTTRPDLQQVDPQQAAQHQSVAIAKSSFGPRLNAFAGWELDNPTFLAGGGGNNWVGGIELQIDIFQGGARRAELSRQRALQEKLAAMKQAASDGVRLEVRRAYYEVEASRQQVEVARTAIAQALESLRMNQDRYNSGLATITDLLGADEAARRSQMDYWEALYRFYTSYASVELAGGTLTPQSPVVTQ